MTRKGAMVETTVRGDVRFATMKRRSLFQITSPRSTKPLTYEEEVELSRRAKVGDRKARQRLIEKNLRARSGRKEIPRGWGCLSRISSRRAT